MKHIAQNLANLFISNQTDSVLLAFQIAEDSPEALVNEVEQAIMNANCIATDTMSSYKILKELLDKFFDNFTNTFKAYLIAHTKGKNSMYAFLRKNNIAYKINTIEHGLHTSKKSQKAKLDFEAKSEIGKLNLHYYSTLVKARNGYKYNVLRSLQVVFI